MTRAQKNSIKKAIKLIDEAGVIVSNLQQTLAEEYSEANWDDPAKPRKQKLDDEACELEDRAFRIGELLADLEEFTK